MSDNPNRPPVALLAVGTEITTGQILNSNAASISQKLTDMGFEVRLHLSVEDSRKQILWALDAAVSIGAKLIVVTGGLGPTSDDFTRDIIAEWFGAELHFDNDSWQQILDRLSKFGVRVAESNRRQCYFPERSEILKNSAGTANGFWLSNINKPQLIALPGPPREIEAIWHAHLETKLPGAFSLPAPDRLLRLQCIGKSESALGEIVEAFVSGTKIKTGYRPHVPYVELKLWRPNGSGDVEEAAISKLRSELQPWILAEDDEDLAHEFVQSIQKMLRVVVLDAASQGVFSRRVSEARSKLAESIKFDLDLRILGSNKSARFEYGQTGADWVIEIDSVPNENSWKIRSILNGQISLRTIAVEYRFHADHRERYAKMLVEKTLHSLNQIWRESNNF
jgi:nicotinamide-nucleotide amidase